MFARSVFSVTHIGTFSELPQASLLTEGTGGRGWGRRRRTPFLLLPQEVLPAPGARSGQSVAHIHRWINNALIQGVREDRQAPQLLLQSSRTLSSPEEKIEPGFVPTGGVQGASGTAWLCSTDSRLGWTQLQNKYFPYQSCFAADRQKRGMWEMYRRQSVLCLLHSALKTHLLVTGRIEVPCLPGHSPCFHSS